MKYCYLLLIILLYREINLRSCNDFGPFHSNKAAPCSCSRFPQNIAKYQPEFPALSQLLSTRLKGGSARPDLSDSEIESIILNELQEKSRSPLPHPATSFARRGAGGRSKPNARDNSTTPAARGEEDALLFMADARSAIRRCKAQNRTLLVWIPADSGPAAETSRAMLLSVWAHPEVPPPPARPLALPARG
jgi:hypothetical protein